MANFKTDEVIARIEKHKGNVAAVARSFGVSRRTILRFADDHPTVRAALDDARQSMLDNAESVLYKKVLEGSTAELIFFLKTQGKDRGYTERNETEHRGMVATTQTTLAQWKAYQAEASKQVQEALADAQDE